MIPLKKENDPRCIEFYQKAFPNVSDYNQNEIRLNWIDKMLKKC